MFITSFQIISTSSYDNYLNFIVPKKNLQKFYVNNLNENNVTRFSLQL